MKEKIESPKPDAEHKAQLIIKSTIGSIIPGTGGVGEAFDMIYKTGYEKRLDKWRIDVSNRLNELSESVSLAELLNNDEFQSLLTEATVIALKNHQEIKKDAILNLVQNSTESPLEYDFKKLFLNYIDQFTSYHLRTLGLVAERHKRMTEQRLDLNDGFYEKILEEVFHNDDHLKGLIMEELEVGKGLITHALIRKEPLTEKALVLSGLGIKFMKLITGIDYTQQWL